MSTSPDPRPDPCGCQPSAIADGAIVNRPGLPALAYRIGTHPTFLRRMIARLSLHGIHSGPNEDVRPLAALGTRTTDDPSIAMLDAWAIVADVLSFYQERIANEGYLRTATERRSILELARAIGYELNPGVAASAYLAFTVEDADGAPGIATVPRGTRIQSIPAQGQLPQPFETSEEIVARAEWNALRPRLARPQELAIVAPTNGGGNRLMLLGVSTELGQAAEKPKPSDVHPLDPTISLPADSVQAIAIQQVYLAGTATNLKPGERLLLVGRQADETTPETLTIQVKTVKAEPALDRTRVDFVTESAPPPPPFRPLVPQVARIQLSPVSLTGSSVDTVVRAETWRERDLSAFLSVQGWSGRNLLAYVNRKPPPRLAPADAGVFAFDVKASPFGHNAPRWDTLPLNQRFADENENKPVPYERTWDGDTTATPEIPLPPITQPSQTNGTTKLDTYQSLHSVDFFAERTLPEVQPGGWVLLEREGGISSYRVSATRDVSLADFALSAKATGIATESSAGLDDFKLRSTTIHAGSRPLALAEMPIQEPIAAGSKSLQLDRMILGLSAGQPLALRGEREDLPGVSGHEIVILADIVHGGGFTTLSFVEGLAHPYVRNTVEFQANVVPGTHGETIVEVLGGGDSTRANQSFSLRRPPLTHVPAATASGAESTLEVRVSGVWWDAAPQLHGLGPADERYVVRIEDDGETRVIFGDGTKGARVPTGAENVTATYRTGIGLPGMVGAGSLTLLQTRPLGIRGVTNPLPAAGAEEPESRDNARDNAPLTVLTMDRIVSLQDFEDFARAFAGIGKARAIALWKGRNQVIHVTIAAAAPPASGGEGTMPALQTRVIPPGSPLHDNLVQAIEAARDPGELVEVATYQPLFFNVRTRVLVNPRHVRETVFPAVEAALKDAFSFPRRAFGQPVTTAEVITAIQGVVGVDAVDLDQLYRYQDNEAPPDPVAQVLPDPPFLPAAGARWDATTGVVALAELLLVNPVGIVIEEMQP